ncbi:MAG: hypothetical protein WCF85_13470 [Rhodospirillaceae bacterium]
MARIDDLLAAAIRTLPPKPEDDAKQADKKAYSEKLSRVIALAFAEELRLRGCPESRPAPPGAPGDSGAERRIAGGIGAKKVDVTWATEESGLILGISVKTINFRDAKTRNFQKNLTNRRADMLMEAVTLHRRFPYAVLAGFFFFDKEAEADGTDKRRSTLANAHARLRLFTGRDDPAGRDEQYERLYLVTLEARAESCSVVAREVGKSGAEISLDEIFSGLTDLVAERNPDFYESLDGRLSRAAS